MRLPYGNLPSFHSFLDVVRHRIYAPSFFVEFVTWEVSNMSKSPVLPSFALAIFFTVSVGPARLWAQAAAKPDAAKPDAAAPQPAPAPAPAPAPGTAAAPEEAP